MEAKEQNIKKQKFIRKKLMFFKNHVILSVYGGHIMMFDFVKNIGYPKRKTT